jgi:hypothetical protein
MAKRLPSARYLTREAPVAKPKTKLPIKPSSAAEVSPTLDVRDEWQNMVASMCYIILLCGLPGWEGRLISARKGILATRAREQKEGGR